MEEMAMTTTWILLPVPELDLPEVKALVEKRQSERGEPLAPSTDQISGGELTVDAVRRNAFVAHSAWPTNALARLAEGNTLTTQRWAQVLDLCSTHPGDLFSTEDVVAQTDLSLNEWRDACRKITLHLKKHYTDVPLWEHEPYIGEPVWPLVTVSGRSLKVRDQLYVGITVEQAARWKRVR
jgi:hypothetical protein